MVVFVTELRAEFCNFRTSLEEMIIGTDWCVGSVMNKGCYQ